MNENIRFDKDYYNIGMHAQADFKKHVLLVLLHLITILQQKWQEVSRAVKLRLLE